MKARIVLVLVTWACLSSIALCGGSVEWEFHALPILKKHPDLLKLITDSLDVSKTGEGIRPGKDFGADQGKRIPPFQFLARPKGSDGAFILMLIIHDQEDGQHATWIEVREAKKNLSAKGTGK